ncbi:MAG: YqaE/Pmp3 family membrane protein [Candidatus Hydrogenedentes bacterium]|nr:YqaE/Pmp3 family membrane protein [Candidatus Hydrogenedentota bacterium]
MSVLRAIVCILFPPLAVYDKGCGSIILVVVLTLLGWIPGIIGAMVICTREPSI